MSPKKSISVLVPLVLIALIGLVVVMLLRVLNPKPVFPEYGQPGSWSLTNTSGRLMSSRDLTGKVHVVSFMFSRCEGICPVMNKNLSDVYEMYKGPEGPAFVSISVDPEHDTVSTLREYAKQWDADPAQWNFLTGPIDVIHTLAVEGFKVGSTTDPLDHSSRLILVDGAGEIRGYYDSLRSDGIKKLKHDLKYILKK